ncbi:MAG TPA: porin [Stellaceae bacterium]|nr:porin [Stellaceae bacterium]
MKKLLLGSTALVAAAAFSGQAFAQQPVPTPATADGIVLGFGGYWVQGYGAMLQDQTQPGQSGYKHGFDGFQEDAILGILGSVKTPSGLTVGARFDYRAENTATASSASSKVNDLVKQEWVSIKHDSFGEVQVGSFKDVSGRGAYAAPQALVSGGNGSNSPSVYWTNAPIGSNTTSYSIDGRATRVQYFTPVLAGFQFSASYAPDGLKEQTATTYGASNTPVVGATAVSGTRDNWGIEANWKGSIGSVNLGAETHYVQDTRQRPTIGADGHPSSIGAGVQLGYGPWSVGGAYELTRGVGPSGLTAGYVSAVANTAAQTSSAIANYEINKTFDVGVAYTVGPFRAGISWSRGYYEGLVDGTKRAPIFDSIVPGVNYAVAKGVTLFTAVNFSNYDGAGATLAPTAKSYIFSKSYTSTALVVGTDLRF